MSCNFLAWLIQAFQTNQTKWVAYYENESINESKAVLVKTQYGTVKNDVSYI